MRCSHFLHESVSHTGNDRARGGDDERFQHFSRLHLICFPRYSHHGPRADGDANHGKQYDDEAPGTFSQRSRPPQSNKNADGVENGADAESDGVGDNRFAITEHDCLPPMVTSRATGWHCRSGSHPSIKETCHSVKVTFLHDDVLLFLDDLLVTMYVLPRTLPTTTGKAGMTHG